MTTITAVPRPVRVRHICPDSCRRTSASGYMDGPWVCGVCGGFREDLNAPERQEIEAHNARYAVEERWRRQYGLPTILKPMKRQIPAGPALPR
jgi:hypothetical protein